jgi:hypothetical protein
LIHWPCLKTPHNGTRLSEMDPVEEASKKNRLSDTCGIGEILGRNTS